MNLTLSDDRTACKFLASRIRTTRLQLSLTQAAMAEKAGIAIRTYKRIEQTGTGTIENLVLILQATGRIKGLEMLFPPPPPPPRPSITDKVLKLKELNTKRNIYP